MSSQTIRVRFADFQRARQAIEQMEVAGLDGANMAFDTESLQRAARSTDSGARDERFLRRALAKIRRGVLIGAGIGLLAGLAVGALLFADGPTLGIVGTAVAATAAGGLVGIAMGGIWSHEQSPAWEETFEAPDAGDAVLWITVTNDDETAIVREVLEEHDGELQEPAH